MVEQSNLSNTGNAVEQQVMNQYNQQFQPPASEPTPEQRDNPEVSQLAGIITDLDRRLRVLEERYANLRKKLQLTDQNLIEGERSFSKEIRHLNDESLQLKKQVNDFNDKILTFSDELQTTANKRDVKVIEKYLALWDPKNFATKKQVKEYLKAKEMIKGPQEDA